MDGTMHETRVSAGQTCQVTGCSADLHAQDKPAYCIKRRLCREHIKADAVKRAGFGEQLWRYCFQCGKLQPLHLFEGAKRSCRHSLKTRRAHANHHKMITASSKNKHEASPQGSPNPPCFPTPQDPCVLEAEAEVQDLQIGQDEWLIDGLTRLAPVALAAMVPAALASPSPSAAAAASPSASDLAAAAYMCDVSEQLLPGIATAVSADGLPRLSSLARLPGQFELQQLLPPLLPQKQQQRQGLAAMACSTATPVLGKPLAGALAAVAPQCCMGLGAQQSMVYDSPDPYKELLDQLLSSGGGTASDDERSRPLDLLPAVSAPAASVAVPAAPASRQDMPAFIAKLMERQQQQHGLYAEICSAGSPTGALIQASSSSACNNAHSAHAAAPSGPYALDASSFTAAQPAAPPAGLAAVPTTSGPIQGSLSACAKMVLSYAEQQLAHHEYLLQQLDEQQHITQQQPRVFELLQQQQQQLQQQQQCMPSLATSSPTCRRSSYMNSCLAASEAAAEQMTREMSEKLQLMQAQFDELQLLVEYIKKMKQLEGLA